MRLRRAFTLVEMLIVLAITAILITLIGIPLVQGFNLTRASQAFAEAQGVAREVASRFNRELSTAATVLDNSTPEAAVEVKMPLRGGGWGYIRLHNAKIDFVAPAQGDPTNPGFNPGRNRVDPTLRTSIGQVILPVAPGQRMTRYFIGLRRPILNNNAEGLYVNSYFPVMPGANQGDNNLFVLYRADVEPYVFSQQLNRYVPNTDFFPVDPAGRPVLNDPGFFLFVPFQPYDNLAAHQQRVRNWVAISRPVVQDDRTDMIAAEVDEATQEVAYDGNFPRIKSMVSFRPARVNSEPAPGNETHRAGIEAIDERFRLASEFYSSERPGWTADSVVRLFRRDPRSVPAPPYYVGRNLDGVYQIAVFRPGTDVDERVDGVPVFNVSGYQASLAAGDPRIGPNIYPSPGILELMFFTVDERRGRIVASFPARAAFGYVPTLADTTVPNGTLTGWMSSTTRQQFNPSGDLARRFVDLRDVTVFPTVSPNFNPLAPVVLGYQNPWAFITPGSEVIYAPDQRPGPNFGRPVRYVRAAPGETVGLNQYRINYTDIQEANYNALGLPSPNSNNDVRLYIQPRFKKGYVEFNSDPNLPMPSGPVQISFDFQVNRDNDAVVVDYDSNQQIRLDLTIRRFPGATRTPPPSASISDEIAVRNFAR